MRNAIILAAIAVLFSAVPGRAEEPQPQPGSQYTMEPITVTATKREQRVKDIATSISTASDIDLENAHVETLQEATKLFPNVYMKSTSSSNEIVIRGFSTWDTALQSPAGLYVDGVPYSLSFMQNLYLQDIEKIEVLRGPQGTLYGRNSESGVINVVRRTPGNTARGSIFAEAGNYDTYGIGASLATPLLEDKVYFSGSYQHRYTDGYVKNVYKDDDQASRHLNDTGRAMLRLTPTDELDVRLSFDASRNEDGKGNMRFATGPNRSGRHETRSNADDESTDRLFVPALVVDYTGKNVKLTSVTSYTDYVYDLNNDLDRTSIISNESDMKVDQWNLTQELRLASVGEQKLSWVTGLFLNTGSTKTHMYRIRPAMGNDYLDTEWTENTGALFGQATYSILDNLRLTAGLRVEHTRLDGDQTKRARGGTLDYGKKPDYTVLLPMASLSWDITGNLTTYATWSQGYLPGGFNVFAQSDPSYFYYDPEYSTNYEAGFKTNWLDNKLLVNVAAFYTQVRDKQVREEDASGGGGQWKFTNAAESHSTGFELEMKAYRVTGLELRGGLGYTRSEVDDWTVGQASYTGNRLPWVPELTYNFGIGYTHESGFFVQADYFGSGKQYFNAENTLSDSGYKLVNVSAGYRGENWEVSVWGKNIFDDQYAVKKLTSARQTIVEDGAPMTFGTTIVWRF